MDFLKLIRFKNLILIALMQCLIHFGFLKPQGIMVALADWQFGLLVLACVCIAAGGYAINNIFDVGTDALNKPKDVVVGRSISEKTAYNVYFGLNVVGVGIGFYLSNAIERSNFLIIFALVAWLLYLYASSFKKQLIIGNVIVAAVLAVSVLIVPVFDIVPAVYGENQIQMATVFGILTDYAVFAFLLNLLREIVKDLEDVNGDYNQGMNTIPIAFGVKRTAKIASVLGVICAAVLGWYVFTYLFGLLYVVIYAMVLLIAPLLFFSVRIWSADKQKEFYFSGQLLKWIVVAGIFSLAMVTLNMKLNGTI